MSYELEGWRRYAVVIGGIIIAALLCSIAVPALTSPIGLTGPAVLQAQSPLAALLVIVLVLALTTAVGAIVGRLVNAAVGLFVIGSGLWGLRLQMATATDFAFAGGSLPLLAVETLLWAGLLLAATLAVFRVAGPLADIQPPEPHRRSPAERLGLKGLAAGALVLPVTWIVARSDLPGQTLMAVALGGIAAGVVGRLLAPHAQPLLLFAVTCAFGAAGYLVAMVQLRGTLAEAVVADTVPALSVPMPADYAAGSLIGVAMGLGWAKGFLQHEEVEGATVAPGAMTRNEITKG